MRPRNTIPPCGFTSRMRSRSGLPHPGQISADRSWRLGVIDAPLETRCVGTETWRVLPVSRAGLTCGGGSRREGLGTPPGTRVTTVHAPQVLNVPSRPSSIMMGSPQRGHKYLIIARCLPTASLARRNQLVSLRTPLLCRQPNQTKQACVRRHRCSALHPHRHRKVAQPPPTIGLSIASRSVVKATTVATGSSDSGRSETVTDPTGLGWRGDRCSVGDCPRSPIANQSSHPPGPKTCTSQIVGPSVASRITTRTSGGHRLHGHNRCAPSVVPRGWCATLALAPADQRADPSKAAFTMTRPIVVGAPKSTVRSARGPPRRPAVSSLSSKPSAARTSPSAAETRSRPWRACRGPGTPTSKSASAGRPLRRDRWS